MIGGTWLRRRETPREGKRLDRSVRLLSKPSLRFRSSEAERQRILMRTGRQPEESLWLLIQQIRFGRPLFDEGDGDEQ